MHVSVLAVICAVKLAPCTLNFFHCIQYMSNVFWMAMFYQFADGRNSKFFVKYLGSIEVGYHKGDDALCQAINKVYASYIYIRPVFIIIHWFFAWFLVLSMCHGPVNWFH